MKYDKNFSDSIKRVFVLVANVQCTIASILPRWIKDGIFTEEYMLFPSTKEIISNDLINEFFVWSWVLSEYISVTMLLSKDKGQEAEVSRKVFSDFISAIAYIEEPAGKEMYEWWIECVEEKSLSNEDCSIEELENNRVDDYLIGLFSLRLLHIIHPQSKKLNLEQLNEYWGSALLAVQEELKIIEADYTQTVELYLEKIDVKDIAKEFLFHLEKGELVQPIIKHWRQECE